MIAAVREWLTGVVVVTLLLSVAQTLIPEGTLRRVASFTGGLILLVTMLHPLLGANLERLEPGTEDCAARIQERQADLERAQKEALAAGIAERTEAYIWDKAAALGLTLHRVRVETAEGPADGVPVPWSVEVEGYSRSPALADCLARDLGIPEERQVWHES